MKFILQKPVDYEVTHVRVVLPVLYEEEDIPNDFPLREGDVWTATIELSTGKISDWPQGVAGSIGNMKVCDEGSYYLLDQKRKTVAMIEQGYVPNDLIPGEYGDYVSLEINEDGIITNWPKNPDLTEFYPGATED